MPASFYEDPLMYQATSAGFLGPRDPVPVVSEEYGIDFEAEIVVVTDDVPMATAAEAAADHIQLVGPCRPLPVFRAGRPMPEKLPRLLLFEGPVSGSGEVADWSQARALAAKTRVILAGGLHPGNVGGAIRTVRPYGVDVSSGVESSRGIKDPELIRRFVEAVRKADRQKDFIGDVS